MKRFLEDQNRKNKIECDDYIYGHCGGHCCVYCVRNGSAQLGIKQDSEITSRILRSGDTRGIFHFATGYFNLTDCYKGDMTDCLHSKYSILMARGPAGGLPHACTLIA